MIASDIMTRRVCHTSPQTNIQEVARLLVKERISGVPVIDNTSHQLVGMITEADIIMHLDRDDLKVNEIMTRNLITVEEDTPVSAIAALLTERIAIARPRTETGNYRARPLK